MSTIIKTHKAHTDTDINPDRQDKTSSSFPPEMEKISLSRFFWGAISELMKQLQRRRLAMALVVNEFGEVEGLATLEDLVEEIVGEIRDEYDREERGPVERLPDGSLVIQGSALLKDLKADFELPFEESPDY